MKFYLLSVSTLYIVLTGILCNHQVFSLKNVEEDTQGINMVAGTALVPPVAIEASDLGKEANKRSLAVTITADMQQMLDLVNAERAKSSLPALCYNDKLIAAAQVHSDDMVTNNFFSHTGSDGTSPWDRFNNVGYSWNAAAENIAISSSIQAAHDQWMNSDGHRANILKDSVQQFGFGFTAGTYQGFSVIYYTQVFAGTTSELCSTGGGGGDDCDDFAGDFDVKIDCDVVMSNTDLCSIAGVAAICPSSCDSCDTCADSTLSFDIDTKRGTKSVDCTYPINKPRSCKKVTGVKEACRDTCGEC